MFTGIVAEIGRVASAQSGRLTVTARDVLLGMTPGGSIAINGVCLTVTGFDSGSFSADIMPETLKRSNLGQLRPGDSVNLERPLTLGGELGGHLVQGHIDGTGRIAALVREGEAKLIKVEAPEEIMRFTAPKGFIAVDGASLTIASREAGSFWVSIVDYTRRHTTLGERRVGDLVNLEADIIAKYVAQFSQAHGSGITAGFLQEHGFPVS